MSVLSVDGVRVGSMSSIRNPVTVGGERLRVRAGAGVDEPNGTSRRGTPVYVYGVPSENLRNIRECPYAGLMLLGHKETHVREDPRFADEECRVSGGRSGALTVASTSLEAHPHLAVFPEVYDLETSPRLEKVMDGLFEGEEAVLHVMGEQIASEKRRNPWTPARGALSYQVLVLREPETPHLHLVLSPQAFDRIADDE